MKWMAFHPEQTALRYCLHWPEPSWLCVQLQTQVPNGNCLIILIESSFFISSRQFDLRYIPVPG